MALVVCDTALTTGAAVAAELVVAGLLCAARLDTPATSTAKTQRFFTVVLNLREVKDVLVSNNAVKL
jgi:hypothetical protein